MLKRCLALFLCILILPCASLAEGGILPALPATDALSFGQVAGTAPAMSVLLEESGSLNWFEAYLNTTPEQYYAFSAALAERDFVLVESTIEQQLVTARVRRSDTEMSIRYIPSSGLLTVEYALGRPATPETIPSLEVLDAFFGCMAAAQAGDLAPEPEDLTHFKLAGLKWLVSSIRPRSSHSMALFQNLVNTYPDYLK